MRGSRCRLTRGAMATEKTQVNRQSMTVYDGRSVMTTTTLGKGDLGTFEFL